MARPVHTAADAVGNEAELQVQPAPFGGRDPGMVLHELVQQLHGGEESPIFAIWGQDLVSLWAQALLLGQRVAFRGTDGLLPFLRAAARGMCTRRGRAVTDG
jgi:hypothetical protein